MNFISSYLGSGILIKKAIKRHGRDCFKVELIAEAGDQTALNTLERYYIELYKKQVGEKIYNIAEGGYGNPYRRTIPGHNKGRHWSPEQRKRMSEAHQGCWDRKPHPQLGTHHSEETKRKIGLKSIGRFKHMSEEHKEAVRNYWRQYRLRKQEAVIQGTSQNP